MLKNIDKRIYILFLMFITNYSKAQSNDTLEIQRSEEGNIRLARFVPNENRKISNSISFLKQIFKANNDESFSEINSVVDNYGITHKKFQQYYKGIKIENCIIATHGKNELIDVVNGNYSNVVIGSIIPSLTESAALEKALGIINATSYKWQNAGMENYLKNENNDANATYYPKGELVLDKDLNNNQYKLSWKFIISCYEPDDEILIFIDANSGAKISLNTLIEYNNFYPSTFDTKYSSLQKATVDQISASNFRLSEQRVTTGTNTVTVNTFNLQHNSTSINNATDFTNTNSDFTANSWTNFTVDRASLDVHWGTEMVLDFWSSVFQRNSLDDNGLKIKNYVHYKNNYNNAYWDRNKKCMLFGDGDGVETTEFVSIDIIAHEMGHGINQFTAKVGLNNGYSEENALNEGLSDIWGVCIKQFTNETLGLNKSIWLVDDEIFVPNSGFTCSRNIQNPKDQSAKFIYPDTYKGINWTTYGDPHYNSGVLSHWFYLVCEGGTGKNDNKDNYNVTGIGIKDAREIVYQAETVHLLPGASYIDARNAMIQSARDRFGANSCQEITVTNAWYAVGVGLAYQTDGIIIGNNISCGTNETYTINNLPSNATVIWSTNDPNNNIGSISSTSGNTTTITKINDGDMILYATINITCSSASFILDNLVHFGKPIISIKPNNQGPFIGGGQNTTVDEDGNMAILWNPCANTTTTSNFNFTGVDFNNNNSVVWKVVSGVKYNSVYAGNVSFNLYSAGQTATYKVTATNSCGSVSNGPYFFKAMKCAKANCNHFDISPSMLMFKTMNMSVASRIAQPCLARLAKEESAAVDETIKGLLIYNTDGKIVREISSENLGNKNASINLSDLPEGIYHFEIRGDKDYKELQTVRLSSSNEKMTAENIANGNIFIDKPDFSDRIYVLQIKLFNELLTTNTDLYESSEILKAFVEQKMQGSFGYQLNIDQLLESDDIERAREMLSSWIPTNSIDENYIKYYKYYIQFKTGTELNTEELSDLFNLASKCSLTSGEAVNAARSFYNYITGINYGFDDACKAYSIKGTPLVCNHFKVTSSSFAAKSINVSIPSNLQTPCFARMAKDESPLNYELIEGIVIYDRKGNVVMEIGADELNSRNKQIDMFDFEEGTYSMEIRGLKEYKELQTFRLADLSEKNLAEDIAVGNVLINKADREDRIYVLQQKLYNDLLSLKSDLLNGSDVLKTFVDSSTQNNFGLTRLIDNLLENNEIDKVQDLLLNWQPSNHIDVNYLTYYKYYITFITGNDLSESDINGLFNLASKCPLTEGEVVNAARSLYNFLTQDNLSFDGACGNISARGITKTTNTMLHKLQAETSIYPNPSKGNFSVHFASNETGRKQLKITDAFGKVYLEKTIPSGENKAVISLKADSGIYFLTITNSNSGKQEIKKVIIE